MADIGYWASAIRYPMVAGTVFPKVDARFRGRGLMALPGLWPWAARVLPVIGFALQAG